MISAAAFDLKVEADRLMLAARFLAEIDIEQILSTIDKAHTTGWIIDPTAYRNALYRGDLDRLAVIARAALPIKREIEALIEGVTDRGPE